MKPTLVITNNGRSRIDSVAIYPTHLIVTVKERPKSFYSSWPPNTTEPDITHEYRYPTKTEIPLPTYG